MRDREVGVWRAIGCPGLIGKETGQLSLRPLRPSPLDRSCLVHSGLQTPGCPATGIETMGSQKALQDDEYREFAARLKQAREVAGLSQEKLAETMGRSQRFVSRCELGERRVDAIEFRDYCKALGLPPNHFVKGFPRVKARRGTATHPKKS